MSKIGRNRQKRPYNWVENLTKSSRNLVILGRNLARIGRKLVQLSLKLVRRVEIGQKLVESSRKLVLMESKIGQIGVESWLQSWSEFCQGQNWIYNHPKLGRQSTKTQSIVANMQYRENNCKKCTTYQISVFKEISVELN